MKRAADLSLNVLSEAEPSSTRRRGAFVHNAYKIGYGHKIKGRLLLSEGELSLRGDG